MKPFESPEGSKGVGFEGHAEIGVLVIGLTRLVELVDDPTNEALNLAKRMGAVGKDILQIDGDLVQDPRIREAMRNKNYASVIFDMDDPDQIELADIGLQIAAQQPDPLVAATALATRSEFQSLLVTQGIIAAPTVEP